MKRAITWSTFLLVMLGVYLIAGPTSLGGPVSYVIVDGPSMEPTYEHGDLVVARAQASYQVGDVIIYDAPIDQQFNVIHRIVERTEGGYITQGDNMARPDGWIAPHDEIHGRALFHAPRGGVIVEFLQQPAAIAAFAGIGSLGFWRTRRHKHRQRQPNERRRGGPPSSNGAASSPRGAGATLLVLTTLILLLAGATVAMWMRPEERVDTMERVRYEHMGEFRYTATVTPSVVYDAPAIESPPDGLSAPPIFISLLQDLLVEADYSLTAFGPAQIQGEVSADLRILAGDPGWTRTLPLLPRHQFDGDAVSVSFAVDVPAVRALIATAEEQTGFAPSRYQLAVVLRVDVTGEADGPLDDSFAAELPMELSRTLLSIGETLTASERVTGPEQVTVANDFVVLGRSLSVQQARIAMTTAFSLVLLGSAVYALTVRRRLGTGPVAKIRLRYGRLIVPVTGPVPTGSRRVEVTSIEDLVRLARSAEQVVFYDQPGAGKHRFFVPDGAVTYEYRVAAPRKDMDA